MSREYFEALTDALYGFLDPKFRSFERRTSSRNVKVWVSGDPREHYEAQLVRGPALEVGFHVEYPDPKASQAVIDALVSSEKSWRKALGKEAIAGTFIGAMSSPWRRISEVWS